MHIAFGLHPDSFQNLQGRDIVEETALFHNTSTAAPDNVTMALLNALGPCDEERPEQKLEDTAGGWHSRDMVHGL